MSQREIAKDLNCHQSTSSRELNRNTGQKNYHFKQAKELTIARRLMLLQKVIIL